jgi:hypothetical protein
VRELGHVTINVNGSPARISLCPGAPPGWEATQDVVVVEYAGHTLKVQGVHHMVYDPCGPEAFGRSSVIADGTEYFVELMTTYEPVFQGPGCGGHPI